MHQIRVHMASIGHPVVGDSGLASGLGLNACHFILSVDYMYINIKQLNSFFLVLFSSYLA